MGNVYSLDPQRNLILYASGKNIYLRSSAGESLTRAVSLSGDYAKSLSDIIYQGTIFYAYQNTGLDIILKNITDTNPYYKISSQDTPDCLYPQITVFQNMLLLFYLVKNPVNEHFLLKCVFPDQPEKRLLFTEEFSDTPIIRLVASSDYLYVHIQTNQDTYTLQIDDTLHYCRLLPHTTLTTEEVKQYELRIRQLQKELSDQNEQLRLELTKRNALLDSARHQYDELMNTALQYRNEAIKWRNKFVGDS